VIGAGVGFIVGIVDEVDGAKTPSLDVDACAVASVVVPEAPCVGSCPDPPPHAVNKTAAHTQDSAANEER
jgi:hypothetical protein